MINYDKIVNGMIPQVKNTIDQIVKENNIEALKKWLNECRKEIEYRKENNTDIYSITCEKYYLEILIG